MNRGIFPTSGRALAVAAGALAVPRRWYPRLPRQPTISERWVRGQATMKIRFAIIGSGVPACLAL
jgi:hypothetical protein